MDITISGLIAVCFVISLTALCVLIWSLARDHDMLSSRGGMVIFGKNELYTSEEPAVSDAEQRTLQTFAGDGAAQALSTEEQRARIAADTSSRQPVLWFLLSSIVWLLIGSLAGMLTSLKMHYPDLLTDSAMLTFGRVRPFHLNAVAYGWSAMAGIGVCLWLIPRLLRTPLTHGSYATAGAILWNIGLIIGLGGVLAGIGDGLEWLEFHWYIDLLLVAAGGLCAVPLLKTLLNKQVTHIYVSVWYISAALVWFPVLFLLANLPGLMHGAEQAVLNWWFAHNVLGLWVTPLALGSAYYLIPKVLGRPVHSYPLSLVGFWALALFYSQVGVHHLVNGPVPQWVQTLSIVQSMMMIVPVVAFSINTHMVMRGSFGMLKHSPTLRFIVIGTMMYTVLSIQGSFEALRAVNAVVHFTHYTVGHAHLGLYAFFSLVMFGAFYFILPRMLQVEWPYPRLIRWHFWTVTGGIAIYVIALSVGGLLQGLALQDASMPFMETVTLTIPYLQARSIGGALMTLGHFIFAYHVAAMLLLAWRSWQSPQTATHSPAGATTL